MSGHAWGFPCINLDHETTFEQNIRSDKYACNTHITHLTSGAEGNHYSQERRRREDSEK